MWRRMRERRSTAAPVPDRRGRIRKIDPATGDVLATIPAPGRRRLRGSRGRKGRLWVGQHRGRKIHQVDPETGAVLRTIESNRFVTGVTWIDGELWHGTWEGEESRFAARRSEHGEVLETARDAAGRRRVRAGVRWRRSVLLRRWQQRDAEGAAGRGEEAKQMHVAGAGGERG